MRRFLPVVVLLPFAAAAQPLSRPAVQGCLDQVTRSAVTIAAAGPACTELLARIEAGADGVPGDAGLAHALGALSADALRDFAATLPDDSAVSRGALPDLSAVAAVLAGLPDPQARPRSFWERVDAWLRRLLDQDQPADAAPLPQWLRRLLQPLGHIPPLAVKITVLLLFFMLVVSLAWVVLRELRAASGAWRRRAPAVAPAREEPLPAEVFEQLPERERPAALLRWVIGQLAARGLLPADEALTNRELQALLPPALGAPFGALAVYAERAFFGGVRLAPAESDQALELAQSLGRRPAA